VTCEPERLVEVLETAGHHGVPARPIGTVGVVGGRFVVHAMGGPTIDAPVEELAATYYTAIPRLMEEKPLAADTTD
jgi:hypothetical protein